MTWIWIREEKQLGRQLDGVKIVWEIETIMMTASNNNGMQCERITKPR